MLLSTPMAVQGAPSSVDCLTSGSAVSDLDCDGVENLDELAAGTNLVDDDSDGDGCLDGDDVFPTDPSECSDFDADGTGDNADTDDDNDGVPDEDDAFPYDPNRGSGIDTDNDGIDDEFDEDDDNDGALDEEDVYPLVSNPVSVVAGFTFHCAVHANGTASCWGDNTYGQLGDGTLINRHQPTAVVGLTGVTQISAGNHHACALLIDETVQCWGRNDAAQVGDGTRSGARTTPTPVAGLSNVMAIEAGGAHTCALLSDHSMHCWGANTQGQLGDGTASSYRAEIRPVPGLAGVVSMAATDFHTCAALGDGTVKCWGNNWGGQIGDGTTSGTYTPVAVVGLTDAVEVEVGAYHTCARLNDGSVSCWGHGAYGQMGDGTRTSRNTPASVHGITSAVQLSGGRQFNCVTQSDNTIACWGLNTDGQTGDGTGGSNNYRLTPGPVADTDGTTMVSAAAMSACALADSGLIKCWGRNAEGQLGDRTTESHYTPQRVEF